MERNQEDLPLDTALGESEVAGGATQIIQTKDVFPETLTRLSRVLSFEGGLDHRSSIVSDGLEDRWGPAECVRELVAKATDR
jgi:hypothetical protein